MTAFRQFSLESAESAARKRRVLVFVLVVAAAFIAYLSRSLGWHVIFLPLFIYIPVGIAALSQNSKDNRLAQAPHLRSTVEMLRSLRGMSFDDACSRLDDVGEITSATKVRLLDPRTWAHPQRQVEFECWSFSGTLTEKFSRVGSLFVMIDDEKES